MKHAPNNIAGYEQRLLGPDAPAPGEDVGGPINAGGEQRTVRSTDDHRVAADRHTRPKPVEAVRVPWRQLDPLAPNAPAARKNNGASWTQVDVRGAHDDRIAADGHARPEAGRPPTKQPCLLAPDAAAACENVRGTYIWPSEQVLQVRWIIVIRRADDDRIAADGDAGPEQVARGAIAGRQPGLVGPDACVAREDVRRPLLGVPADIVSRSAD